MSNTEQTQQSSEATQEAEVVEPAAAKPGEQPEESGAGEPDPQVLKRALEEADAKAQEYWDKLLRAQAELENLRKRSQRDLENAHKYAIEKLADELLPVKDSLELGLSHSSEETDAEKLHEGMELTLKMLTQVMERFNIAEIDPQGLPFNPELHQAMTLQENAELAPNTVVAVMQKGYTLNERLLRPAMVIVSKQPESSQ